ncbi:MAG: Holliday junction DNA helicase RuvA [Verrucomicrobiales bacterium]|jgi:Holliday junction DNA helicase RuvA
MIGSIRGTLLDRNLGGDEVLVEVSGIGYRVLVAPATSARASHLGSEVFLHVHHQQREDAQILYGFSTIEERRIFEIVISAHGVGPSLGMAILSVHGPGELKAVLATEDIDALCAVPGVGKKTATRLLIELKSKLDLPDVDLSSLDRPVAHAELPAHIEVRQALDALGYTGDEVRRVLSKIPTEGDPALLTRDALRLIAEGV